MIGAPSRDDERAGDHPARLVDDEHLRFGREHCARIFHQGEDRDFPVLPVRLAQPPDYAVRLPNTPACFKSERTVSVGFAPLASQASA